MTATLNGAYRLLDHVETDHAAHERRLGPVPWSGGPRTLIPLLEAAGKVARAGGLHLRASQRGHNKKGGQRAQYAAQKMRLQRSHDGISS